MRYLEYEFARLRTDYYLSGVSDRYRRGKAVPPPRYVIWDCTRRCNLHCAHCGASEETYAQELTTEQIVGVVEELAALRVDMFAVTGGEPLLRRDLLEIMAHAHDRGLKTGVATNGFWVDAAVARQMGEAGVFSVQVSLDGLASTHNAIRGSTSSFTRAVRAIERLQQEGIPVVSAATTVTPRNLAELSEMQQLLIELGVRLWRLTVVMPIGRARDAGSQLSRGELVTLFEFVRDHNSKQQRVYLAENLTYLGEWEQQLRDRPAVCPVGLLACCIGVDGHVRGCPEQEDSRENREGSVLERPVAEIWRTGFARYRERQVLTQDHRCAACRAKLRCYGGCWVMRTQGQHCVPRWLSQEHDTRIDVESIDIESKGEPSSP